MSHRQSFTEDYEFEVTKERWFGEECGYSVSIPHQCDRWEIIGADVHRDDQTILHDGRYPALPFSKELAINQMELFVQRAQEALEKLRQLD